MISYAVLDLDHTLISSSDVERAWVFACGIGGVEAASAREALWSAAGTPAHRLFEALGFDESTADRLTEVFWNAYDIDAQPLAGAEELLGLLRSADLRVYLSTGSHPQVLGEVLDRLDWRDRFDLALGTERGCEKGAEHYERFVADAGVDPIRFAASALCVGDGAGDMAFGRAAGVAVRCGIGELEAYRQRLFEAGATHVVPSTRAAVEFVEGLIGR